MKTERYPALHDWVQPARERAQIWRLVAGLFLIATLYLFLNFSMIQVLGRMAPGLLGRVIGAGPDQGPGGTPLSLLIILASFGFLTLAVAVALRGVHQRGLASVLGPPDRFRAQFSGSVFLLALVGAAILILPPYDMGLEMTRQHAPVTWVLLLPFGLIGVLIQTASEEVLFRGYIQQNLAARARSPLVWMGLPSLLFAVGHYNPAEAGENALLIALWAGLFGLLMADLTARAGTLGPAIAVHFANNIAAMLIVALPDSLSGLALYIIPSSLADTGFVRAWLPVDFAMMVVFWLAARLAIRR